MHANGQRDMMNLIVAFSNFAKASENDYSSEFIIHIYVFHFGVLCIRLLK
jgi:hypothetical protein